MVIPGFPCPQVSFRQVRPLLFLHHLSIFFLTFTNFFIFPLSQRRQHDIIAATPFAMPPAPSMLQLLQLTQHLTNRRTDGEIGPDAGAHLSLVDDHQLVAPVVLHQSCRRIHH